MIYSTEGTHIQAFRERTEKNVAMLSAGPRTSQGLLPPLRDTPDGCNGCGKK